MSNPTPCRQCKAPLGRGNRSGLCAACYSPFTCTRCGCKSQTKGKCAPCRQTTRRQTLKRVLPQSWLDRRKKRLKELAALAKKGKPIFPKVSARFRKEITI